MIWVLSAKFEPNKSHKKIQQYSQRFFELHQDFTLYAKLSKNFHFTYYLHTNQTTYYMTYLFMTYISNSNSFIFDIAYSTRTNLILCSNLN